MPQEPAQLLLLLLSVAAASRAHAKRKFNWCCRGCRRRRHESRSLDGPPTHAHSATAALPVFGACDGQRHRDGPKATKGVASA